MVAAFFLGCLESAKQQGGKKRGSKVVFLMFFGCFLAMLFVLWGFG